MAAQREHFLEELLLPPVETPPEQIVQYCMAALRDNDKPCPDAVMFINWALGGDMARTIHNGDPNRCGAGVSFLISFEDAPLNCRELAPGRRGQRVETGGGTAYEHATHLNAEMKCQLNENVARLCVPS